MVSQPIDAYVGNTRCDTIYYVLQRCAGCGRGGMTAVATREDFTTKGVGDIEQTKAR
jgi:hypothetical protein